MKLPPRLVSATIAAVLIAGFFFCLGTPLKPGDELGVAYGCTLLAFITVFITLTERTR